LQPEFNTTELSAWRVPLGADVQEGLPGRSLKQITVDDLEVGADDDRSEDSFRPDWLTLAFQPRVAPPQPPRPVRFLRRRNGVLVVPELVIGNDDRVVFTPLAWPWTLIGRIDTWVAFPGNTFSPAGSGTGALVGKNVVLTASHLVPWWAEALGRPWMMKFVPAYYDGFSKLGAGVYSYVSELRGYADHSQGDDMAVLKLYQPLGESLGFFGYKTYNDDWEGDDRWIIMGYPAAVAGGNRPSLQFWVIIHDDDSGRGRRRARAHWGHLPRQLWRPTLGLVRRQSAHCRDHIRRGSPTVPVKQRGRRGSRIVQTDQMGPE
jgi:hypothetical protein